jgi:hypothetical protein
MEAQPVASVRRAASSSPFPFFGSEYITANISPHEMDAPFA